MLTSSENLNHLKEKERIKEETTKEKQKKEWKQMLLRKKKKKNNLKRETHNFREKEECLKGDKQESCTLQVHTYLKSLAAAFSFPPDLLFVKNGGTFTRCS